MQTELPTKVLEEWLGLWTTQYRLPAPLRVELRPHTAGSDLLELRILNPEQALVANVIFAPILDRRGHSLLSIRDQNTLDPAVRQKRLMSLVHLYLIHRYKAVAVHYVSPTEDNQYQTQKMKAHGLFKDVLVEVGHIIAATVDTERIRELTTRDSDALRRLIEKR
jgi:isocitrate lyase